MHVVISRQASMTERERRVGEKERKRKGDRKSVRERKRERER